MSSAHHEISMHDGPSFANEVYSHPQLSWRKGTDKGEHWVMKKKFMEMDVGVVTVEGAVDLKMINDDRTSEEFAGMRADILHLGELNKTLGKMGWVGGGTHEVVPFFHPIPKGRAFSPSFLYKDVLGLHPMAYETPGEKTAGGGIHWPPATMLWPAPVCEDVSAPDRLRKMLLENVDPPKHDVIAECEEHIQEQLDHVKYFRIGDDRFNPVLIFVLGLTAHRNMGGFVTVVKS